MSRSSATLFLVFLIAVLGVQAGLLLGKGVLLVQAHDGDALHIAQIVFRMADGQWPHLDFTTPIGVMSFAPIAFLLSLDFGIGHSILGANLMVAAALIPAIWWAGLSRLSLGTALFFGATVLILATAMVHGGNKPSLSISMIYNRWAWALGFVVILLAVLPARERQSQLIDGIVLGLFMALLVLSKVTYFVALFPAVAIALVIRRQWTAVVVAIVAGMAVALLVTILAGVEFWLAYLGDIQTVSNSGFRAQPGYTFTELLIGPIYAAANICLLASVIFLRRAGFAAEGLILFILAPGLIYITYQNWGNDPQWLLILAVILLGLHSALPAKATTGWSVEHWLFATALAALAIIFPSAMNLTTSTLRHAQLDLSEYSQVIPDIKHVDFAIRTDRFYDMQSRIPIAFESAKYLALQQNSAPDDVKMDLLNGEFLPACRLQLGLMGMLHATATDLDENADVAGKSIFVADAFANLWLFGDSVPVPNGAVWYYGGDAGLSNADYLLVPLCPVAGPARSRVLEDIAGQHVLTFTEVRRTGLYILLARD